MSASQLCQVFASAEILEENGILQIGKPLTAKFSSGEESTVFFLGRQSDKVSAVVDMTGTIYYIQEHENLIRDAKGNTVDEKRQEFLTPLLKTDAKCSVNGALFCLQILAKRKLLKNTELVRHTLENPSDFLTQTSNANAITEKPTLVQKLWNVVVNLRSPSTNSSSQNQKIAAQLKYLGISAKLTRDPNVFRRAIVEGNLAVLNILLKPANVDQVSKYADGFQMNVKMRAPRPFSIIGTSSLEQLSKGNDIFARSVLVLGGGKGIYIVADAQSGDIRIWNAGEVESALASSQKLGGIGLAFDVELGAIVVQ